VQCFIENLAVGFLQ